MSTEVYFRTPDGILLTVINNYVRLEYARGEGQVGYLYLDVDPAHFDEKLLQLNARLEPWRTVGANPPYLDGETVYFLQDWGWVMGSDGSETLRLECLDANMLLDHKIIAYAAGSSDAEQTDEIDDMAKDIVRHNLGADCTDTLRNLGIGVLTVQADATAGTSITKGFARRKVLTVLQELAAESLQKALYMTFDIVYTGATTLEFRVYTGQRGINHGRTSASPVVISRERLNFEEPALWERHSQEHNYIYAGGQGVEAARVVKTASTAAALGINRREYWIDARMSDLDAAVQSEADGALYEHRNRKTLTGRIVDTAGCQDGVNFRWGDLVYAEYRGMGYDAHLDVMHVTCTMGTETRDNQIRGEAI